MSLSKLEEKVTDFEERLGVELTETKNQITNAYSEIDNVSSEIKAAKEITDGSIDSETSSEELRALINDVKESIKNAHREIMKVIEALREELPKKDTVEDGE